MIGKPVKVHWNLRKRCWSVLDGRTGRLVAHVPACRLEGVAFRVGPAGRARTLRTGHRNVHAFAVGVLAEVGELDPPAGPVREVRYNPYWATTFIDKFTGEPVHRADTALLLDRGRVVVTTPGPASPAAGAA